MKTAIVHIEGVSPYQFSRYHGTETLDRERPDDYEKRTWREKAHFDDSGNVLIPPMCFKNSLTAAAKYLGMKIKGKRNNTYTKHFTAGVLVTEPLMVGLKKDQLDPLWLFVPSDGKRGGGSRVHKCFPIMKKWEGDVQYLILDEIITKEVFEEHVVTSGSLIGVGAFRPENNGYFGRFKATVKKWS